MDADQCAEQHWFVGAHGDVGGGYRDGRLQQIPVRWMQEKAKACGLNFREEVKVAPDTWLAPRHDSLRSFAGGVYRRLPWVYPELAVDVFKPLDGGIELPPDEIKGRNTWNRWGAGDEQLWDRMSRASSGLIDLLKTIDLRQRRNPFKDLGLINEPGYKQASKPDPYGLWIDEAAEPKRVGFVWNVSEEKGKRFFRYDTSLPGTGDFGHEGKEYGTELSIGEKDALVECLKTF